MKPIHNCFCNVKKNWQVVSHHKVNDLNETNSQLNFCNPITSYVVSHHKVNDLNETNSQLIF